MGEYKEGSIEWAMGRAAQAWCKDKTSKTVMDTDLAKEFANILFEEMQKKDDCFGRVEGQRNLLYSLVEHVKIFFDPSVDGRFPSEIKLINQISRVLKKVDAIGRVDEVTLTGG